MDEKDKIIQDLRDKLYAAKVAEAQALTDLANLQQRISANFERYKQMCEKRVAAAEQRVLELEEELRKRP
jgi:hypothetical protein